jgi:hypothetical protein
MALQMYLSSSASQKQEVGAMVVPVVAMAVSE